MGISIYHFKPTISSYFIIHHYGIYRTTSLKYHTILRRIKRLFPCYLVITDSHTSKIWSTTSDNHILYRRPKDIRACSDRSIDKCIIHICNTSVIIFSISLGLKFFKTCEFKMVNIINSFILFLNSGNLRINNAGCSHCHIINDIIFIAECF